MLRLKDLEWSKKVRVGNVEQLLINLDIIDLDHIKCQFPDISNISFQF